MEIITVENLKYIYKTTAGEKIALDDINLKIFSGEFIAIIGTNGSGKSTLAKHFNAILQPTSGKVFVKNLDTAEEKNLWKIRSEVGMVFQNPDNEIVAAIVEDDVAFGPENLGIEPKEIKNRVDLALNTVGMIDYKKFSPSKLSGGQKQRIAIAGAVAMQTKIIVFDEPTAMLDPQGRREVLSTIKKLHAQGLTIILITHFMDEAAQAEKIFVMKRGKILKFGTPQEIFSDVKEIKKLGLDVPAPVELADRLRRKSFKLPKNILSAKDFSNALIRLKK